MTEEELREHLQGIYDNQNNIGIAVYVILKNDPQGSPKKADIESTALQNLKSFFIESVRENITDRDSISLLNLSSSDERTDAIYIYDLELPKELSSIETIISNDNVELFDFRNGEVSNIKALLIEIGNNAHHIVLYKNMASVNIFKKSSFFLKKHDSRFEKINEDFLRISSGFQLLRVNGELLVIDLSSIERSFGFHEVIKREAELGIKAIEDMGILSNPETLVELSDQVKYARKLTKVARHSPVIKAEISNDKIISFCQNSPHLKGRIRFDESKNQIVLDTNVSKDLFIKLLMDDLLTSELTNLHYTSLAKDEVEEE